MRMHEWFASAVKPALRWLKAAAFAVNEDVIGMVQTRFFTERSAPPV